MSPKEERPVTVDSLWVQADGAHLNVTVRGTGPLVVLMPSLGRGAADFDGLCEALVDAGFRAAAVDPRGAAQSSGATERLTLHNYADDLAAVIRHIGGPAHVVGHAFGNRVVRCLASDQPDLVSSLTLLACGGTKPADAEAHAALKQCFRLDLPRDERLRAISTAFFAPGNDPAAWEHGWWPCVAAAEMEALRNTPLDEWWHAGSAPVLAIQGLQDRIAPPGNSVVLREQFGSRATVVELDNAAHALLPEAPERITSEVVEYLSRVPV
jgi:pimeloyl-ACP methyl ester carboxylesterase